MYVTPTHNQRHADAFAKSSKLSRTILYSSPGLVGGVYMSADEARQVLGGK